MRARVVEDLARLRGKCSLKAEDKYGITPAQTLTRLALQHVQLLREIYRGLANPKKRPGHLGFLEGWPLNEFSIATYSM